MLEKKKSFALTLFTFFFLKFLWYIKTLTSQISCCWLLRHFDYNHLMSDIISRLLLSMLRSLSLHEILFPEVLHILHFLPYNRKHYSFNRVKKGLSNTIAPSEHLQFFRFLLHLLEILQSLCICYNIQVQAKNLYYNLSL